VSVNLLSKIIIVDDDDDDDDHGDNYYYPTQYYKYYNCSLLQLLSLPLSMGLSSGITKVGVTRCGYGN